MIDFSKLKTPEEKLIVLFLSIQNHTPIRNIWRVLHINKSGCYRTMKVLEAKNTIHPVENFETTFYELNQEIKTNGECTEYTKLVQISAPTGLAFTY